MTTGEEYLKARARKERLEKATTIDDAIFTLVDRECPYCNKPLELPSLEDIQNWLEENEQ